jgi:hypothetical protein
MIQLTGQEIVDMYLSAIALIQSGKTVAEAHASIGVLPGTKLHSILCDGIDQFLNFPDSKITLFDIL